MTLSITRLGSKNWTSSGIACGKIGGAVDLIWSTPEPPPVPTSPLSESSRKSWSCSDGPLPFATSSCLESSGLPGVYFCLSVKFSSTDYLESHSEAHQSSHQRSLQLQSPLLLLLYPFQFTRVYQMVEEGLPRINIRSACLPPLPPVPLLLPSMVGFIPALTAKPAPVSNSVW